MSKAAKMIGEIIDHFTFGDETPGDEWAASDDLTSFGLDHRSRDGTKFWIDLDREDGSVSLMWQPNGADRHQSIVFREEQ